MFSLLLVQATARDARSPAGLLAPLVDSLGNREEVISKLRSGDPEMAARLSAGLEGLAPEDRRWLVEHSDRLTEDLRQLIHEGRLPVPLPLPIWLPLIIDLLRLSRSGEAVKPGELTPVFSRRVSELGSEDARLLGERLDEWIRKHPRAAPDIAAPVAHLRSVVYGNGIEAFWRLMLAEEVRLRRFAGGSEVETRVLAHWQPGTNDREILLPYADELEASGYPGLAARLRALVGPDDLSVERPPSIARSSPVGQSVDATNPHR